MMCVYSLNNDKTLQRISIENMNELPKIASDILLSDENYNEMLIYTPMYIMHFVKHSDRVVLNDIKGIEQD